MCVSRLLGHLHRTSLGAFTAVSYGPLTILIRVPSPSGLIGGSPICFFNQSRSKSNNGVANSSSTTLAGNPSNRIHTYRGHRLSARDGVRLLSISIGSPLNFTSFTRPFFFSTARSTIVYVSSAEV